MVYGAITPNNCRKFEIVINFQPGSRVQASVGTHLAESKGSADSPPLLKREIVRYAEAASGYERS
jgi:hypothetical protein